MSDVTSAPRGILASLRKLADGLLAIVGDHVALIAVELEEEKLRLIRTLLWISAAIVTGVMTLAMISATLIYLFWEKGALAVILVLTALHGLLFLFALLGLRRVLYRQPAVFSATLEEIAEDRSCLRDKP
ncbi:MAG TPA: phage holin family protein [Acidobacteriota bacterium]|nr:phage holin family protein [Acidobacteriota bacterium]